MSLFDDDDVVPLVTFDGARYAVHPDAVSFLRQVQTPIAVVSIAGRYRTGKSFLLNTLCQADEATFAVGDTTSACTKGLHIRKTPLHASENLTILVVDTEGISSLCANEDHDVKILALALLLSSTFLYNSVGAIDDAALQSLNLMTKVSELVRADAESRSVADATTAFPRFFWCLRDFSLRLVSADGRTCTADEYLEDALAERGDEADDRNRTRRAIRETFPTRSLITLARPAEHTQKLRRANVSRAFTAAVDALRAQIVHEARPLRAGAHALTGSMLAHLCGAYADALNTPDAVPTIRDSWSMLMEIQARDACDATYRRAERELRTASSTASSSPSRFARDAAAAVDAHVAHFRESSGAHADMEAQLRADLDALVAQLVDETRRAFHARVEEQLTALDARVAAADVRALHEAVVSATAQWAAECDDDALARWQARCLERMLRAWLPAVTATTAADAETRSAEAAEARTRCAALEEAAQAHADAHARDLERLAREHDVHLTSATAALRMQLEAATQDHEAERARAEEAERGASAVRVELAALRARCEEEEEGARRRGRGGEEEEEEEDAKRQQDDEEEAARFEERQRALHTEAELRSLADELREITAIRDALVLQCAREKEQREKAEHLLSQRLAALQQKHNEAVQRLRKEGDDEVQRLRAELAATSERDAAVRKELAAARQESARAAAARDEGAAARRREVRAACEGQLASRAACEDLQLRLVELHRNTLADLRERENAQRERLAALATEQLQMQVKVCEAQRREEQAAGQVRELKRKAADDDEARREAKRVRETLRECELRQQQMVAENEKLRGRLDESLRERQRLQADHIRAESARAALAREMEMVQAEQVV